MTIDDQRTRQRQAQQQAIEQRRSANGVSRIGNRDTETGKYSVIGPDGSSRRDGIKIFSAQVEPGTPVLSTDRTDGLRTIDSLKGAEAPNTPQPLAPAKLYREGRVFEIPEPKKGTKGPIHILFFDDGRFWVGGHQDDSEEVLLPIVAGNPIWTYDFWADSSGWIVTRRSTSGTISSVDSEGAVYNSPASPDNFPIGAVAGGSGYVGFGTTILRDNTSPNQFQGAGNSYVWKAGQWAFNRSAFTIPTNGDNWSYSVNLPRAFFPGTAILSKTNDFADIGFSNTGDAYTRYWSTIKVDRTSVILRYDSEDYMTGDYSGYFEQLNQTTPPTPTTQFYPYLFNDFLGTVTTPVQNLPSGMYTEGQFTNITSSFTQLNNLKSGPGLITITVTGLDRITTNQTVEAAKIPATAAIITAVTTIN
jgi:hypothetical protein